MYTYMHMYAHSNQISPPLAQHSFIELLLSGPLLYAAGKDNLIPFFKEG
jgi:hypothetical protein